MLDFDTIFRLTPHVVERRRTNHRYPTYMLRQDASAFFRTLEEAEDYLSFMSRGNSEVIYCYSLSELPIGIQYNKGQSCSERVYLSDGKLWSVRDYADMHPNVIPPQYREIEFDNYIYGRCIFDGRRLEEIRFHRGDIIEIFCYEANDYWSGNTVELAIVVVESPTKEVMKTRIDHYLKTKARNLTGNRGFDLGVMFYASDDTYMVIPAYLSTETESLVDYCPTHCAMVPRYKVSPRIEKRLRRMLERINMMDCMSSL